MRDPRSEQGSVLLLMPVAVLVVLILGSLAVDQAITFGAQRELVATAQVAANDAAAVGIDLDRLRSDGSLHHDPARIESAVARAAHGSDAEADTDIRWSWAVEGDTVVVRLRRSVHQVFAPGLAQNRDLRTITATASARLVLP